MDTSNAVSDRPATEAENRVSAALGAALVTGVYTDGWAHFNLPDLETFFTPWHGVLYGSFGVLALWLIVLVWRRRSERSWRSRIPHGYGIGLLGIAVFAAGGVLDMAWHLAFGVEVGIEALLSPTHLVLLTGGVAMVTSPLRAATGSPERTIPSRGPAVTATITATALAGFFLIYTSVFAEPRFRTPFNDVPEGAAGHVEGELAAVAGLAGYLVTTLLILIPLLYLRRRSLLPIGAVTAMVAAVAIPAAALTGFRFWLPAVAAAVAAVVVDVVLAAWPRLPLPGFAALIPAAVWAGQLLGSAGAVRWSVELWSGVVVLTALASAAIALLLSDPARAPRPTVMHEPDRAETRSLRPDEVDKRVVSARTGRLGTTETAADGVYGRARTDGSDSASRARSSGVSR